MGIAYALAAATAFVTLVVHSFVGGPVVVRPLLAATDLTEASRWLAYFCWHIATVVILFMALALAHAAFRPAEERLLAAAFSCLALVLGALSAAVALKGGIQPFRFPSTGLFLLIGALGAYGAWRHA